MRFRTTKKWTDLNNSGGLLFFAQKAEELLFDYSLDSYKVSSLNAPYLCREAISVIQDVEKGLIDDSNLKPVIEELSWSLSNDAVAKSLLDLEKKDYLLDYESEKLDRVKLRLEVLSKTLQPTRYLDRCKQKLSYAVKNGRKKDIDTFSRFLFTTLVNMGCHKKYLYEKTVGFFYAGDEPKVIDCVDCIDDYLSEVSPKQHEFKVVFLASSLLADIKDSAENVFRVKFHNELPEEVQEFARANGFWPSEDEVIAEFRKVGAFDWYKAREIANGRLCRLRDVFTLYHHKNQIDWRDTALMQQCCADSPRLVEMPTNPIEKVQDQKPDQASESLNWMLKNFRMERKDFQKFKRAIDFHGLSVNNSDPENQLLNLWIALETIVPSHTGSAKIRQVTDSVVPFLGINYFLRLIENVTQDLLRWNRRAIIRLLKNVPNTEGASLRRKVLVLLVDPDSQELRNELYGDLRDFHLLRFRVFSLSELMQTPSKALGALRDHERKVAWQIRRIYRTRNLIVHSGATPNYMHSLIENGHDYLDQVIFTVTKMSGGEYSISTIEQSFELAKMARKKIEGTFKGGGVYTNDALNALLNEHDFN